VARGPKSGSLFAGGQLRQLTAPSRRTIQGPSAERLFGSPVHRFTGFRIRLDARPPIEKHRRMPEQTESVVYTDKTAAKLPDGVIGLKDLTAETNNGCRVFVHYNGPTDQLQGISTGMAVIDPGVSPHPPHQHPEEELMWVTEGTGEIECNGKTTQAGPGSIMYCAGNVLHGIFNTGPVPMTFYWSKWLAKGA
jgi:mannose-6-phosphate isomerase-like protein (cupin superfamily)